LLIVLARFVGSGNEQSQDVSLLFCDSQGNTIKTIPASAATASGKGFCVYEFDPRTLPNPVWLRWTAPDGDEDLAGPCDPMKLHDLLVTVQMVPADPMVEGPGETPDQGATAGGDSGSTTDSETGGLGDFTWT
jgi:hypothetical protein